MGTAADVLRLARAELGTTSGKKYWDWYFNGTYGYVNGSVTPYCACFTSFIFDSANVTAAGLANSYCPYICSKGSSEGKLVNKYAAQPGDIVLFDWNQDGVSDHVGIVESNEGSYLQTIEGNTSGGIVTRRTRNFSDVCHVIRPNYDGNASVVTESNLDVDGWAGPATITKLQIALNVPSNYVDGVLSGQSVNDRDALGNVCSVEWSGLGSYTVERLQEKVGAGVDGYWGMNTSKCLQRYLINHGYYCGEAGADGYFGYYSCCALQRALNEGLFK